MTIKKMPRVGGGHGSVQKSHPRLHRICLIGYGWGYIGRGLKGGFKSGTEKKNWQEDLNIDSKSGQEVWTESLDRKSRQKVSKKYVKKMT